MRWPSREFARFLPTIPDRNLVTGYGRDESAGTTHVALLDVHLRKLPHDLPEPAGDLHELVRRVLRLFPRQIELPLRDLEFVPRLIDAGRRDRHPARGVGVLDECLSLERRDLQLQVRLGGELDDVVAPVSDGARELFHLGWVSRGHHIVQPVGVLCERAKVQIITQTQLRSESEGGGTNTDPLACERERALRRLSRVFLPFQELLDLLKVDPDVGASADTLRPDSVPVWAAFRA